MAEVSNAIREAFNEQLRNRDRRAHIAGLKEALGIVYAFTGKKDSAHQGSGIGPAWDAIRSRIEELEKDR